jgi:hypothetical protein
MRISRELDLFGIGQVPRHGASPKRSLVPVYRVGEPLQRGRRRWPTGAQYTYGPGGHELTLFRRDVDERMIQDVKLGEAEFAVISRPPVIVLAYRFGHSIPWDDATYCWHFQPPHWRTVPDLDPSPEARALIWITLVEADGGFIRAQRGMTLAPGFTSTLHAAIRAQARTPFDPDRCTEAVADLMVAHPSTSARLPFAQARTLGNL